MLNEDTRTRLKQLCDIIEQTQDAEKYAAVVAELNELLDEHKPPKDSLPTQSRRANP
jgi:hypothetical protein